MPSASTSQNGQGWGDGHGGNFIGNCHFYYGENLSCHGGFSGSLGGGRYGGIRNSYDGFWDGQSSISSAESHSDFGNYNNQGSHFGYFKVWILGPYRNGEQYFC